MVTVSRTIDGLEVSATPHMAFPEGNRIAAALLEVLAPVVKLSGMKLTVDDGSGGRKPIGLQEVIRRVDANRGPAIYAFLADVLRSVNLDEIVAALVAAIRRLFLDDPAYAERLFLAILSNSSATVPAAGGGNTRISLGSSEALRSVIGANYARQFKLLAFALEVSFKDFFGGGLPGGLSATGQP